MTATATITRTPDLLDLLRHQPDYDWPTLPAGMVYGWRSCRPDLRSRDGYRWPWPGGVAVAPADGRDLSPAAAPGEACPSDALGGLCLARTWQGAASGAASAAIGLLVAYRESDVLGAATDKIRVFGAAVLDVIDVPRLGLTGANLTRADLSGAVLYRANLAGANLRWANLTGALRSEDDPEIPGWTVVDGELERDNKENA